MKNLSHKTCIRLKDAGFPQPKKQIGQIWCVRGIHAVIFRTGYYGDFAAALDGSAEFGTTLGDDWVYCPTALELLAMLTNWSLSAFDLEAFGLPCWRIECEYPGFEKIINEADTDASETLAEIWLSEIWLSENQNPV